MHVGQGAIRLTKDLHGKPSCRRVRNGAAVGPLERRPAVTAESHGSVALGLERGALRDEIDGPCDGVAAVYRSLRPLEHFHSLKIEQPECLHGRLRDINAVGIYAGGLRQRFDEPVRVHAAYRDQRIAEFSERRLDVEARRVTCNIDQRHGAGLTQPVAADHVDRNAHIRKRLFTLLCGDYNFFEHHGRFLCNRDVRNQEWDREGGKDQQYLSHWRVPLDGWVCRSSRQQYGLSTDKE